MMFQAPLEKYPVNIREVILGLGEKGQKNRRRKYISLAFL